MQQVPTKKKKLGSYPYLTVVFSIALALTVIGIFSSVMIHAKSISDYVKKNIELHVYLNNNISDTQLTRIESLIASKPFVLKEDNNVQLSYISKDQAVVNFIQETGEDFTEVLGVNPLKASVIIKIDPKYSTAKQLNLVKDQIENIDGVYEVDYNSHKENEVRLINDNIFKILYFLSAFTIIAILTIIVLINNTIKIALFSQRFLIRSMQLVGATSSFIQWPFVRTAAFQGLSGGIIASLVIMSILQYLYADINELMEIVNFNHLLILLGGIPVIGLLIAAFSSYFVIKRYLKLSLDELY